MDAMSNNVLRSRQRKGLFAMNQQEHFKRKHHKGRAVGHLGSHEHLHSWSRRHGADAPRFCSRLQMCTQKIEDILDKVLAFGASLSGMRIWWRLEFMAWHLAQ